EGKPVTPAFLFAAFLWQRVSARSEQLVAEGLPQVEALAVSGEEAFAAQAQRVAIHRRFSSMAKEMWCLQPRFERRRGKRAFRLMSERRFRAAYDFLLLRAIENPELQELADWWTTFQEVDGDERREMTRAAPGKRQRRKKRRKAAS